MLSVVVMAKFNTTTISVLPVLMVVALSLTAMPVKPQPLVNAAQSVVASENARKPVKPPGAMRGQVVMGEDFDAPLALSTEIKI